MEDFRTSLVSDCSLMKTVTSTKKSWCAALPIRKRKIKSIASSNWIDCRLLLQQVQKAILHMPLTGQSPNVDQLNITEVQISIESRCKKKFWQIQLNGKNQPNHRSEPAEPLDSPHESPISKRKFCSRRRLSTRTFVWIFANMRHFFRTSSPGLYENCNFRFAKRPYCLLSNTVHVVTSSILCTRIEMVLFHATRHTKATQMETHPNSLWRKKVLDQPQNRSQMLTQPRFAEVDFTVRLSWLTTRLSSVIGR